MGIIKALLIFSVTSLSFAVMARRIRTNQLRFLLCMLVGMAVRPAGLLGKRLHAAVIALQPKVNVRTTLVVFSAGAGYAVFFGVSHHGVAVLCICCYTVHEA